MQHTELAPSDRSSASQQRTLRIAWGALIGFFSIFLFIVGWAIYAGRQFYLSATNQRDATVILRGPAEWVSWQPANRSIFQGISDQQMIGEGDSVRVVTKAGYGQITSVRLFDESQLDLWAGADLRFDTLQTTRWSDRLQEVTIRQSGGYVRYDLRSGQPYNQVRFRVLVGNVTLDLAPGGSYSVSIQPTNRIVQVTTDAEVQPFTTDVAVRSGTATVQSTRGSGVVLGARQRVEIDQSGAPGLPVPARWELIRDGWFSLFSEAEYNNTTNSTEPTLTRSDSWEVYGTPPLPVEQQGFFRLSSICRPPNVDNTCAESDRRTAAWFYRAGGQTSGFTTGIRQQLGTDGNGIDISEYRTLTFSLWVRVIDQSLEDVGDRGSECPVMIRLLARQDSPDDPDQQRVVCIYTDTNDQTPRVKDKDVLYYQIPKAEWQHFTFNLRDQKWLPDYRYLQGVQIYANGHDYNSLVAEVSLIGEQ
ncbi:hypothetical protein K2Z83_00535 [Oscillochloris sp. ZM17-4]|uniref:hypothetical protein n=1 Tax=Oscillochloris sp. ZM17-4 TaxID=2866714 RepID=UPI001C732777|nr:hypothetical protein [Oscillochloris sp. ZM17-4]MBX0326180.1 hypothetical protein [Oscillochloris sp. ZM17-4]